MTSPESLTQSLGQLRRAMLRDGLAAAMMAVGDQELSLAKMAVLTLLDDMGEQTAQQLCRYTGRSPSAMSRLLDQLVERGWITRREDPDDRRHKRLALAGPGRAFLAQIERRRAEAQLAIMAELTEAERTQVMQAMQLLAQAAQRRKSHDR